MVSREFLLFGLDGPMTAFGDIAVGEQRSLWDAPSKSAILGLIAGALGLTRDQTAAHQALEDGFGFAVRVDAAGYPLRDYHTAQAPRARKNGSWRTRRDELAIKDELNTVLSERIYRLEATSTVALWRKADVGPVLLDVCSAIARPQFTPYLGRKACPFGRPPFPRIVEAGGLLAAFDAYDAIEAAALSGINLPRPRARSHGVPAVWFEWDAGLAEEEKRAEHNGIVRLRRDALRDRSRWQFADRREGRLTASYAAPEEDASA